MATKKTTKPVKAVKDMTLDERLETYRTLNAAFLRTCREKRRAEKHAYRTDEKLKEMHAAALAARPEFNRLNRTKVWGTVNDLNAVTGYCIAEPEQHRHPVLLDVHKALLRVSRLRDREIKRLDMLTRAERHAEDEAWAHLRSFEDGLRATRTKSIEKQALAKWDEICAAAKAKSRAKR